MQSKSGDDLVLFPSPLDTWPIVPWRQNARKLWTVSPPREDVEWDDWDSQELLCVGYGISSDGEIQNVEPNFDEPNFDKTGIDLVDTQVRDRILQEMVSAFQTQHEQCVKAKKVITKENRLNSVRLVQEKAAEAENIGPSAEPALSRALDAATRLLPYLEPELVIDPVMISSWEARLASWKEDAISAQPHRLLQTTQDSDNPCTPAVAELSSLGSQPELSTIKQSVNGPNSAEVLDHSGTTAIILQENGGAAVNDSNTNHRAPFKSSPPECTPPTATIDSSGDDLYTHLFSDEMQFLLDLRRETRRVGASPQRCCTACAFVPQPADKFCPSCGARIEENAANLTPVQHASTSADGGDNAEEYIADLASCELPRAEITLLGVLGAGNFGEVRQGRLRGSIDVALKTSTKDDVSKAAFLAEASKMKFLTHPNLLKMHGVVTSDGGPTMIVLEFMGGGDLQEYLRSPRGKAMSVIDQCKAIHDVAAGMAFLSDNHWIHGDLAARNLLISTSMVVKVCDFGHTVQTDEEDTPVLVVRPLAFRWTAPELYATRRNSPACDVWSFGVVIHEILSRGEDPYGDIFDNKEVMQKVAKGYRMPRHKTVWRPFYEMMRACWLEDAALRPRFSYMAMCCNEWKGLPSISGNKHGDLVRSDTGEKLQFRWRT